VSRSSRTKRQFASLGVVLCAGLVAAGCGSSSSSNVPQTHTSGAATQPTAITIAQYAGIQSWITQVAIAGGFFKKNGIDATGITVNSGPQATAALATGDVQLIVADTPLTAPLMAKGTKLAILTAAHRVVFSLMGAPGQKFPHASEGFPAVMQDLKGKSVGVYGLGTTAQFEVEALLAAAGMSKNDVTFEVTPGQAASLAALDSGRVDTAMVSPPAQFLAAKSGAQMLVDLRQHVPGLGGAIGAIAGQIDDGVWTSQAWLSGHKAAAKEVQTALVEAGKWIADPANTAKLLSYVANFGVPAGSSTEQLQFLRASVPVITTTVSRSALNAWMNLVVTYGLIPKAIPISQYLVVPVPGIPTIGG